MDFINETIKYFSDNILLNTLVAIIFFTIGAVASSFLEPFGKKLYSFINPPKISIKIDFENRGISYPSQKFVNSRGLLSIPTYEWVTIDNYNYYILITNISEIALNNITLNLEHDIKFISNYEDDEKNDEKIKKEFYIDHLQSGKTISFLLCNERLLINDSPIKITITIKESKKNIIQNKILRTGLERKSLLKKL